MFDIHDTAVGVADVHGHGSVHDVLGHDADHTPLHVSVDPWSQLTTSTQSDQAPHADSVPADGMAGNPDEYQNDWFFQGADGLCAPSSITEVLAEHAGMQLPDNSVVEARLAELGYPSTFLTMEQTQETLQSLGVPCHLENASAGSEQATLENYLSTGHSIILAVNASPIWYGSDTYDNPSGGEDHALVISAIDPSTGEVTLSDPGTPNGNEEHVPWSTFQDAWSASDFKMIVTDDATGGADHNSAASAVTAVQSGGNPPSSAPTIDATPTDTSPITAAPAAAPIMPSHASIPQMPHVTAGQGFPHVPGPILLPITFGAAAAAVAAIRKNRKNGKPEPARRPLAIEPARA